MNDELGRDPTKNELLLLARLYEKNDQEGVRTTHPLRHTNKLFSFSMHQIRLLHKIDMCKHTFMGATALLLLLHTAEVIT